MADEISILRDLQAHIKCAKLPEDRLSTLSVQGDEHLVREFLTESVKIDGTEPTAQSGQLYMACFWGLREIVQQLINIGADCNQQNPDSKWTPLHAATFQEHGPIVMMLLENKVLPEIPDAEGRTPKDFASASDKIWPHFAVLGLTRTSKVELYDKKVLKRGFSGAQRHKGLITGIRMASNNRPDSGYELNSDLFVAAAATGDVLADISDTDINQAQTQPRLSVYK